MNSSPPRDVLVQKRFTLDEVQSLVARSETLLGRSLQRLLDRHASGGAGRPRRHRLIELLQRMREGAQDPDGIRGGVAAVNAPELHAVLDLYDEWHTSSAWPELQRMLCSPAEFLHTVATLALANQLRTRHPRRDALMWADTDHRRDLQILRPRQAWTCSFSSCETRCRMSSSTAIISFGDAWRSRLRSTKRAVTVAPIRPKQPIPTTIITPPRASVRRRDSIRPRAGPVAGLLGQRSATVSGSRTLRLGCSAGSYYGGQPTGITPVGS